MIRPVSIIAAWIACSLLLSGCGESEPPGNAAIAGEYRYDALPFAASIEATLVEDALRRGPSGSTEEERASVRALARGQAEKIATSISATLELRENGAAVFVGGDMRDAFVKGVGGVEPGRGAHGRPAANSPARTASGSRWTRL
jgi:hypothetical protein